MNFLRVALFTLISYYLLLHLGFCKAYQNCLVALIKITTLDCYSCDLIFSILHFMVFQPAELIFGVDESRVKPTRFAVATVVHNLA